MRNRRVEGLRREELASLAGVSVGYCTRLEQGQSPNVSEEVLDSVARVLGLNGEEVAHLHGLARASRGRERARPERLRPGVRLMVDSLTEMPAIAVGRRGDILAHALLAPHRPFEGEERPNFVLIDFLETEFSRGLHVDGSRRPATRRPGRRREGPPRPTAPGHRRWRRRRPGRTALRRSGRTTSGPDPRPQRPEGRGRGTRTVRRSTPGDRVHPEYADHPHGCDTLMVVAVLVPMMNLCAPDGL
ncbi:helix-turn-helix domain-containing protein [Streptosporangium sp. NPDC020072]|uniref:helix-turn-helix domain-containing protein n=1 Tax=Streptosporangium sp. NPDC020072 TaxID=3154788 RepID=UPI00342DBE4B